MICFSSLVFIRFSYFVYFPLIYYSLISLLTALKILSIYLDMFQTKIWRFKFLRVFFFYI